MILHVDPHAPWAVRALAEAALWTHVGGWVVGIGAGFVAVAAPKGEAVHRAAGNIFFAAMTAAYAVGAIVAPLIHQPANALGAAFAIYLIATAWMTVKRPQGQVGGFETAALAVIATAAFTLAAIGVLGLSNPRLLKGVPAAIFLTMAAVSALAAHSDLKLIRAGGISGAPRIARHLWRMCLAFFFGTGSLFLGQPNVFPPPLRHSPVLWTPALAPLAVMLFWLARTRGPAAPAAPAIVTP